MDDLLTELRAAREPSHAIRNLLAGINDPAVLRRAGRILADLPADAKGLRAMRVSVLATCTIGPFTPLLRAGLVGVGVAPSIAEGEYGTFEISLAGGTFADGDPDLVCCLLDESYFLPRDWSPLDPAGLADQLDARLAELRGLLTAGLARSGAAFTLHTVPLPAQVRDSVLSVAARAAICGAWYRLNAEILGLAELDPRIAVVDLVSDLAELPIRARDERLHRYADQPYTDGALLALARGVSRVAQARSGRSRKVLAVDLDNTLWGGVLGEVGMAGVQLGGLYPGNCYTDLQRTIARLREQGVILVLASKNDPALVDDALSRHPEMLLRPEAFAVRAVNWSPKATNLRGAAETLNLAVESFVFLDDSPFERGHVAEELPEVAVLAADGDPAYLVDTLLRRGWFDVPELTDTDRKRPELYRSRALRTDFATGFGSSEEYLAALGIELLAAPITPFEVGRVAQLAARTNQFNLTGIRFDEAATTALADDPANLVASFAVADRFGDEGIVGAAWIERVADAWWVRNLVMSCRVFGRGIEFAIADWILRKAQETGVATVVGSYTPSERNGIADGFWPKAGFQPSEQDGVFTATPGSTPSALPSWITYRKRSDG
ncbi:MAG TPA: HAD-IIIC family phosphatase [Pseudonocardiaceae bacterium]|jgi:FkbH-like protein|nr:HAD-IIIC family phosphatase [Pseudonocardiaceae bacterium]